MKNLRISVQSAAKANPEEPQHIGISADGVVFTRLLRPNANEPDDYLQAPPAQLAYFLVDNWWRLRWECIPPGGMNADWRLAHELAGIGGGYVWPRLAIWGEGDRIGMASRSDPPGVVGPVRYLTDALLFQFATPFEEEIDRFLRSVVDAYDHSDFEGPALKAQVTALTTERSDEAIADWRRMEARLGYDPDEAPDALIEDLAALVQKYGKAGVEEAAMAAPGLEAAETLREEISAAQDSRVVCRFGDAIAQSDSLGFDTGQFQPPWSRAEVAASALRAAIGAHGPIRNQSLADILETQVETFRGSASSPAKSLPYGLRLHSRHGEEHVAVRSRWAHDRRFEMARALGDAIWAKGETLGPLAASKTARQKFQRAFAQSLLCPYEDLMDYIGTEQPTDSDLSAAARHFHVSERVVRTALVNKHVIDRSRIHPSFEELVDVA